MASTVGIKKRKGRPATGINLAIGVRLSPEMLKSVDRWRAHEPNIPGRPEAIRRLIEISLVDYNNHKGPVQGSNSGKTRSGVMSPQQTRAARAWLGWSQLELAKRARLSLGTVQTFERGERVPLSNNVAAMQRVLEEAGIRLVFDRSGRAAGIARFYPDICPRGEPSL
jgi:DNA-binding transcriptional regulator YiaG